MRSRTTIRVLAVLGPVLAVVAAATPAMAETPATWPEPDPMSTLDALLIFGGIPVGLAVTITLLVMAPSVAKGPRYRPGLSWWATPEWFGESAIEGERRPALAAGTGAAGGATAMSEVAVTQPAMSEGGAGARW